eukprot:1504771-Pyramimonas_sp.AAC.1
MNKHPKKRIIVIVRDLIHVQRNGHHGATLLCRGRLNKSMFFPLVYPRLGTYFGIPLGNDIGVVVEFGSDGLMRRCNVERQGRQLRVIPIVARRFQHVEVLVELGKMQRRVKFALVVPTLHLGVDGILRCFQEATLRRIMAKSTESPR